MKTTTPTLAYAEMKRVEAENAYLFVAAGGEYAVYAAEKNLNDWENIVDHLTHTDEAPSTNVFLNIETLKKRTRSRYGRNMLDRIAARINQNGV
jgi:hypothetical protein